MAIWVCIRRTSPDCFKRKSGHPYNSAQKYDWICPACAGSNEVRARRSVRTLRRKNIKTMGRLLMTKKK